jgi:hypothetical protein
VHTQNRCRLRLVSHLRRSELFSRFFPDLPVWANLCRAYGAGSRLGALSADRIAQEQRKKRSPEGGRYKFGDDGGRITAETESAQRNTNGKPERRLPGSIKLNRPLQIQRQRRKITRGAENAERGNGEPATEPTFGRMGRSKQRPYRVFVFWDSLTRTARSGGATMTQRGAETEVRQSGDWRSQEAATNSRATSTAKGRRDAGAIAARRTGLAEIAD